MARLPCKFSFQGSKKSHSKLASEIADFFQQRGDDEIAGFFRQPDTEMIKKPAAKRFTTNVVGFIKPKLMRLSKAL